MYSRHLPLPASNRLANSTHFPSPLNSLWNTHYTCRDCSALLLLLVKLMKSEVSSNFSQEFCRKKFQKNFNSHNIIHIIRNFSKNEILAREQKIRRYFQVTRWPLGLNMLKYNHGYQPLCLLHAQRCVG